MNQSENRSFSRQIGGIVIGLALFAAVIFVWVDNGNFQPDGDANPIQKARIENNINPIGRVRVGAEGAAALAVEQAATEVASVEQAVAEADPAEEAAMESDPIAKTAVEAAPVEETVAIVDGEQVYGGLCMSCHQAGVAGAPIPGSDLMAQRLEEQGIDGLVTNVINGLNVMPPRGGNPGLTDDEIRAAVEFMLP
jgi:cytochrome c5